jgi:hypothetical protein
MDFRGIFMNFMSFAIIMTVWKMVIIIDMIILLMRKCNFDDIHVSPISEDKINTST